MIDLIGKKFGRLMVLRDSENRTKDNRIIYLCKCDCGTLTKVAINNLKSTQVKSCGCLRRETWQEIGLKYKHGDARKRLYNIWAGMKNRCLNSNSHAHKRYGARGIKILEDWKDNYNAFKFWALLNSYKDDLVIDRIDNNGNYEPTNCRWITRYEHGKKSAMEGHQ